MNDHEQPETSTRTSHKRPAARALRQLKAAAERRILPRAIKQIIEQYEEQLDRNRPVKVKLKLAKIDKHPLKKSRLVSLIAILNAGLRTADSITLKRCCAVIDPALFPAYADREQITGINQRSLAFAVGRKLLIYLVDNFEADAKCKGPINKSKKRRRAQDRRLLVIDAIQNLGVFDQTKEHLDDYATILLDHLIEANKLLSSEKTTKSGFGDGKLGDALRDIKIYYERHADTHPREVVCEELRHYLVQGKIRDEKADIACNLLSGIRHSANPTLMLYRTTRARLECHNLLKETWSWRGRFDKLLTKIENDLVTQIPPSQVSGVRQYAWDHVPTLN